MEMILRLTLVFFLTTACPEWMSSLTGRNHG